jgi:M6 family metalloprotease-like protein
MRDYYAEVSYGNFSVSPGSGGIAGWYTAAQGHDYYRTHDNAGNQQYTNTRELVEEAVQAADSTVDFSQYDNDGNCFVDAVIIIHQGEGRESSGDNTDIHSHQWNINYTTNDIAACGTIRVGTYTMQPERQGGALVTMGVFAHELGHALGLPDLYDRDYSSEGIGDWGVMAGGSWNGVTRGGDTPAHMSAWSKYFLGWVTPTQVTGTLPNELVDQAATSADVYQLLSGGPPNTNTGEYFLVENRQQTGFDTALPGSGLAIWHIDDSITTQNDQECSPPNNCSSTHYRVALVQADGLWELESNRIYARTICTVGFFNCCTMYSSNK